MKPTWIIATLTAVLTTTLFASPTSAQLASPQSSRPAMDSTHVTGTAQRVMPETPPGDNRAFEEKIISPLTIRELLAAFDGVVLDLPGREGAGGFGRMRFVFAPDRMQAQLAENWNWYDSCSANDVVTRCSAGDMTMMLSPEGLIVIRQGCKGLYGAAGGSAEFKWTDFMAFGGPKATAKQWTLQRDTFWSNCYADNGSND